MFVSNLEYDFLIFCNGPGAGVVLVLCRGGNVSAVLGCPNKTKQTILLFSMVPTKTKTWRPRTAPSATARITLPAVHLPFGHQVDVKRSFSRLKPVMARFSPITLVPYALHWIHWHIQKIFHCAGYIGIVRKFLIDCYCLINCSIHHSLTRQSHSWLSTPLVVTWETDIST